MRDATTPLTPEDIERLLGQGNDTLLKGLRLDLATLLLRGHFTEDDVRVLANGALATKDEAFARDLLSIMQRIHAVLPDKAIER